MSDRGAVGGECYRALLELIVTGGLAPGERLVETRIAARLGVSRTPLRAAIARLARERFVVVRGGRRRIEHCVAPLAVATMRELWQILGALECAAACALASLDHGAREAVAEELATVNTDLEAATTARPRDVERIAALQTGFHAVLIERLGGPHLRAMHESVRPHVRRYEWVYGRLDGAPYGVSIAEHWRCIAAVRHGDAPALRRALEDHWAAAAERTAEVIDPLVAPAPEGRGRLAGEPIPAPPGGG